MNIPVDRTTTPRLDAKAIQNGRLTNVPGDHMFIAEYAHGEWRKARIQPYRPIPLAPLSLGLHYAQLIFEGMKAYKQDNGDIAVFRTDRHHERFNKSAHRMVMPEVPYELFADAIHTLVDVDRDWIPQEQDSSYYIRPFMIASEERMGLKASEEFLFMVVGGPFRPLYGKPVRVKIEREYSRAAPGGTGAAKCAGNYAAAMYPTKLAQAEGFDQVIWTDARNHEFVEESGTMNVAFVIDGAVVTPGLSDTILDGVTRDSVLHIARDLGYEVQERPIPVDELAKGLASGSVTEAFGVGTAAFVAPIGSISIDGEEFALNVHPGCTMFTLKNQLYSLRQGLIPDSRNWMNVVGGKVVA